MSKVTTTNPLEMAARIDVTPAVDFFTGIPPALAGAISRINIEMLSAARLSIIRNAGQSWPGKRQAQKFVASQTFRYGRTKADPVTIADAAGELFAAGTENIRKFEEGGVVRSAEPMLIPIDYARNTIRRGQAEKTFRDKLAAGAFVLIGRRLFDREQLRARSRRGAMPVPVAILVVSRREVPRLKFKEGFERQWSRWGRAYDLAAEAATTAAGIERLERFNAQPSVMRDANTATRLAAKAARATGSNFDRGKFRRISLAAARFARMEILRGGLGGGESSLFASGGGGS